jgi:D-glycero-D-manno-heptose 1,7-bisphosphate phosphatase
MALKRAVFLDRDGVLNHSLVRNGKPYAPRTLNDFRINPEAISATRSFKNKEFLTVVVTNQPDVGNGFVDQSIVEEMHVNLSKMLMLDKIKVCYHSQQANCSCRKPKPGMLYEAASELNIDLSQSFMIGDRAGDVLAGKAAGCTTIFLDYSYSELQAGCEDFIVLSLQDAARVILERC